VRACAALPRIRVDLDAPRPLFELFRRQEGRQDRGRRGRGPWQAAFYDNPNVLTISLHENPATLWPGTAWPSETGGPGAAGSAVNVALPAKTGDAGWLRAFDAVVPPPLRAFRPDVLVSQHGCDTHWLDPLADLRLSIDAQRVANAAIHQLAHEVAGGHWLLTGEGGYELLQVVPRTWTHLLAEAAGCPIDPGVRIPAPWREDASAVPTGRHRRP
jgi:acetoin utilization protein AcuC